MHRVLVDNHIRGVKTNIPFLLNVLAHPDFRRGTFDLNFIEENPNLMDTTYVPFADRSSHQRLDEVEGCLKYTANLAINGHTKQLGADPAALDQVSNIDPPSPDMALIRTSLDAKTLKTPETPSFRKILRKQGPESMAKAIRKHPRLLVTDTTWRDAHQSLLATRMRTADILKSAEATNTAFGGSSDVFSVEMWGGATFDVAMRFLHECPWKRLESIREKAPDVCFQMLLRGANAVGYTVSTVFARLGLYAKEGMRF